MYDIIKDFFFVYKNSSVIAYQIIFWNISIVFLEKAIVVHLFGGRKMRLLERDFWTFLLLFFFLNLFGILFLNEWALALVCIVFR